MMRTSGAAVCDGFTLLELLVALAIFGLLAAMSYSGLQAVLEQQSYTEQAAERLGALQKMYLLMQRDFEQIVPRTVRDEFGDAQLPLVGGDAMQFTRGGWRNPAGRQRSTLQRVGYAYDDEQLVRYTWLVLDRAQDSEPLQQPLIDDIESMQLRYLSRNDEWEDQWPNAATAAAGNIDTDDILLALPKAIEVTIEHSMFGTLVWLFQLPQ